MIAVRRSVLREGDDMHLIQGFLREEGGEDLIEYGLLAAFIAGVALFVLLNQGLRGAISNAFAKAISALVNI
jgi:Flp pilus assembly pilin Flp